MTLKELLKTIDKKEWRFVFLIAAAVVIITALPYLYGYFSAPPNLYYLGTQSFNPADVPNYYSWIEQIKQGNFLLKGLMTSENQVALLFNPFFLVMGLTAKIFNLSSPLVFQLFRTMLIPVGLVVSYTFISYFFNEKFKRKTCLVLLAFSSGLGALASELLNKISTDPSLFWYYWPMDLWVTESNTFLTFYHNPLHLLALIFIISIFLFLLLAFDNNKIKYSLTAGFLALTLFLFHPYHPPTIYAVTAVYLLLIFIKEKKIKWDMVKHYAILVAVSLPSVLYHLILLRYDWIRSNAWKQWFGYTPALWVTAISFGLPLLFALIGILTIKRNKEADRKFFFVVAWFITSFFLIYFWFLNWPRKLTHGLHVPIIILATVGLFAVYDYLKQKNIIRKLNLSGAALILPAIVLLGFSNFYAVARDFKFYHEKNSLFYISQEEKEAMDWIKENTTKDSSILASNFMGNLIAGFSGRAVFSGHAAETAKFAEKMDDLNWFFGNNLDDERKKEFLKKYNLDYVFCSNLEKQMGNFKPEEKKYLETVYQNSQVVIYKVKP